MEKENIKKFLSLIDEYQDPINKEIKDDKEAEEIWALMRDLESKLEDVMSDKINKETVDDWNVEALKEDVKKVILTYVKDTKQIEKNKFAEDKGMRRIMLMSFNANASNLKLFADCFTDLYLSVIDEMNIQKELDRCISIRNEKAQKGFFKVGSRR